MTDDLLEEEFPAANSYENLANAWSGDHDDEGPNCLGPEGDCWDTHVPPCPLAEA